MQTTMEEKHIDLAPLAVILKHILISKIGETFGKFQKEMLDFFPQSVNGLLRANKTIIIITLMTAIWVNC